MARTNNLTNFLNDVATAIKAKLGDNTPIPASQFDTKIGEIETVGTYQSKTINVTANGSQTVTPDTGYDALSSIVINVQVPVKQLQSKTYNFTENTHIVLSPEQGYDGFSSIDLTINVPGSTINNQDKTIIQNGTYVADSGYTGLGTVIVNVPQEGVKKFESVEQMQASTGNQEGDLALVYGSQLAPLTENSIFQYAVFPETVELSEAISSDTYINAEFSNADDDTSYDSGYCMLSEDTFGFSFYNSSSDIRIEYTSEDGKTYTRTDSLGNPVDFGVKLKFGSRYGGSDTFDNRLSNFVNVTQSFFGGVFEYKLGVINKDYLKFLPLSSLDFDSSVTTVTVDESVQINQIPYSKLEAVYNKLNTDYSTTYIWFYYQNVNENLRALIGTYKGGGTGCEMCYDNNKNFLGVTGTTGGVKFPYTIVEITDIDTQTYQVVTSGTPTDSQYITFYGSTRYYYPVDTATLFLYFNYIGNGVMGESIYVGDKTSSKSAFNNSAYSPYLKEDKFVIASSQLSLKGANQLLNDIVGYGKTGVITGDGSIYNNLDMVQLFNSINGTTVTDKQILTQSDTGKGQFTIYGDDVPVEQNVFVEKSNMDNGYLYNRGETFLYSTEDNTEKPMLCKVLDNRIFHFLDSTNGVMEYQRVDRNNKNIGEKVITTLSNTHIFDVISDGTYWYIVADTTIYKYNPVNKSYTTVYTGINNGNGAAVGTNNSWFRETALFYDNNYLYVKNCYLTGTQQYKYNGYTEVFTINLSNNSRTNLWSAMGGSSYMFYIYNDFYKCNNLNFVKYNNYVYIAVMNGTNISLLKCTPTSGTILNTGATGGSKTMCYYQTLVCDDNYLYYLYSDPSSPDNVSGCYRYNGSTFTKLDNVKANMYGILYPIYVDNVLKFCGTYLYNIDGTTYHSTNELRSISPQRDVFQEGNVVILTGLHRPKGYYNANAWFAHDEVTAKVNVLPYISNDMIDFGYATYKQTSSSTTDTYVRCKSYLYAPIIGNTVSDIYYNLNDGFVEPGDIE